MTILFSEIRLEKVMEIARENCLLFVSDAAGENGLFFKMLKQRGFAKLVHMKCGAHFTHNVAKKLPSVFPFSHELIDNLKSIYVRAPARRNEWRTVNPNVKLPPKYVETRFCTWIQSAIYLAKEHHREALHNAMIELLAEKIIFDKAFSILHRLNTKTVVQQLDYIKVKFECFVVAIRKLERYRTNLIDTVQIIEQLKTSLDSYVIEEEKADAAREENDVSEKKNVAMVKDYFENALNKNTGYLAIRKMVLDNEPTLGIIIY